MPSLHGYSSPPSWNAIRSCFSVVNAWAASAWELLRFVQKKWLKNVVFVLQQADLRESNEVAIIHRHLEDTANEKLGFAPPLFAVFRTQSASLASNRPR